MTFLAEGRMPSNGMEKEASLSQVNPALSYEISYLRIFSEFFLGPLKTLWWATCGPWAANRPPLS